MSDYLEVEYDKPKCSHLDCDCQLVVTGRGVMSGYKFRSNCKDKDVQLAQATANIASNFRLAGDNVVQGYRCETTEYIKTQINGKNVTLIEPPLVVPRTPEAIPPYEPDPRIKKILKAVDRVRLPKFFHCSPKDIPFNDMWDERCTSLRLNIFRRHSAYWMAYGTERGRKPVISAQNEIYPYKLANAILLYQRPVNSLLDIATGPLKYLQLATDLMYGGFGITEFEKIPSVLDFGVLAMSYLGASSGQHQGHSKEVLVDEFTKIKISNNGKKAENIERDMELIYEFLVNDKEFDVMFTMSPKNENFFDRMKMWNPELYAKWGEKLRLFIIPTSTFMFAEKLVSQIRMMKERGKKIQIGRKWSYGGAQFLAELLGLFEDADYDIPFIVEGDVDKFDQSVNNVFIKWYMATMLIHEDPQSTDYAAKEKLVAFLAKHLMNRITRMFADVWGVFQGGVPSGCYNTSHMDSWIMCLYVYLWLVWTLMNTEGAGRMQVEEAIRVFGLIVYGDDHLWCKGKGPMASKFSGVLFAKFMKEFFDVTVRDIKDGIPLRSISNHGYLERVGACFLKHYFVSNPSKAPGQAKLIPFRETPEYIMRAVWGKEVRKRDLLDILLSVLGHAYGTYASNRDAYDILGLLYIGIIQELKMEPHNALRSVINKLGDEDIRKLRQLSLTTDDIMSGFPAWEKLVSRNRFDRSQHAELDAHITEYALAWDM